MRNPNNSAPSVNESFCGETGKVIFVTSTSSYRLDNSLDKNYSMSKVGNMKM